MLQNRWQKLIISNFSTQLLSLTVEKVLWWNLLFYGFAYWRRNLRLYKCIKIFCWKHIFYPQNIELPESFCERLTSKRVLLIWPSSFLLQKNPSLWVSFDFSLKLLEHLENTLQERKIYFKKAVMLAWPSASVVFI